MASFKLAEITRNALADQFTSLIDAGAGAGEIHIYTGSQPATPDVAPAGTLLGTLTFSERAAPAASGGVLTCNAISQDSSAVASGEAGWARVVDSAGNAIFDCDVTASGGGGTVTLNTVMIVEGGGIRITSFTIMVPLGS